MSRLCFAAWILPLVLLAGCASGPEKPEKPSRMVVGAGTSDDRSVITTSNQQIFGAEHALSPDPTEVAGNPAPTSAPSPRATASPGPTPTPAPTPSPKPTSTSKP